MRLIVSAIMVLALGACDPTPPDSGAGVGFGGYTNYAKQRAAREAQLQRQATPAGGMISDETVATARQTPPRTQTPPPQQTSVPTQAPLSTLKPATTTVRVDPNNPSISDEQDFDAVAERESIESDRERLERQREQYVQIAPTAVPTGGGGGASVVNFALTTTNRVGQSLYRRSKVFAQSRYVKNCLKFPSPDLAQAEFLQSGGPQKDRKGLDPDGDGFACAWDPQPFRNAKRN